MLCMCAYIYGVKLFFKMPPSLQVKQDVFIILVSHLDRSEWLLFNANSAIFQLCHGENKLIFNEMMMRSALF